MDKKLLDKLKKKLKKADVESVTVSSDSKKGLEEGLDVAKKLMSDRKMKNGGKKYENGGYDLPEELKEKMKKLKGSLMPKEESEDKYNMPDELKEAMKKALKKKLKK